ncbi:LapA family protein [Prauserella cavernicola]|uniref:Uncharacterized protein n=1 Tax=Prauserella cavernicola TaxID=2800127 RepID=A0A934QP09_9PSEU|nr:LapA family protein [Prauserella cavernicola]MBK1784146.1 hypothetical protein [Prauserella cavernicola]
MSIFGQVWVFSAIAFVLGALLAWLFLVRPAQKRIRELERRLVASESAPAPPPAMPAAPEPGPLTRTFQPAGEGDREEPVAPMPSTRGFEPANTAPEQGQAELTQHLSPVTSWPERDSLQGHRAQRQDEEPVEDDFHLADQPWDLEPERSEMASVLDPSSDERDEPEQAGGLHRDAEPDDFPRSESFREQQSLQERDSYREPESASETTSFYEPESFQESESFREVGSFQEPESFQSAASFRGAESLQGVESFREPEPVDEPEPQAFTESERHRAPEPEPQPYSEPASHRAPDPDPEPEPERPRRAPSLFEPVPFDELDDEPQSDEPEDHAPPAYAFGGADAAPDQEDAVEQTQILPKRQPRSSPLGGFDAPKPIQPSMRSVTRREPESDGGAHSGSLFEPSVAPGGPPPARESAADELPPGPFGPGSAMPRPGGGKPSDDFGVKASVTALRYCTEDSPQFPRMVAEVWFRTPADAERVGFRPLS